MVWSSSCLLDCRCRRFFGFWSRWWQGHPCPLVMRSFFGFWGCPWLIGFRGRWVAWGFCWFCSCSLWRSWRGVRWPRRSCCLWGIGLWRCPLSALLRRSPGYEPREGVARHWARWIRLRWMGRLVLHRRLSGYDLCSWRLCPGLRG